MLEISVKVNGIETRKVMITPHTKKGDQKLMISTIRAHNGSYDTAIEELSNLDIRTAETETTLAILQLEKTLLGPT